MSYKEDQEVLGYDGELFREGQGLVRQARLEIDALQFPSERNRRLILEAVSKAIIGTRKASEAIHHPATTPLEYNEIVNSTSNPGHPDHFQSDSDGLGDLERFMDPSLKLPQ